MRRLAALIPGGCLAATLATAQAPPAPAPPAPAPPAQAPSTKAPDGKAPEYDPKAVVTIKGVVVDFHESKARGDNPGLHIILKTETETVEVHTCPLSFMADLEFTIAKGDELTVEGSRPDPAGVVVAREIVKGQTGLIMRDKTGAPVWTR